MTDKPRRPASFDLDATDVAIAPPSDEPLPARSGPVEEAEPFAEGPARGNRWLAAFWTGLGGLISLGFGLAATRMIEDLFARAAWLGWVGVGALILFLLASLVLAAREFLAIRRLAKLDTLRARAEAALASLDDKAAGAVAEELLALLSGHAATARGRAAYAAATTGQIIDGRDKLRLLEREILEPIDREATRLVAEAARRVSVVTAISPKAAVDLAMVCATAIRLVRRLAELYGGRPGTLGVWRLARQVTGHLAVTGGMAAGDTILDQLIGHGLAAKLSAKLGEGVLNGLLTARLGVTAIGLTRPLPYIGAPKPDVRDLIGNALSIGG